MTGRRRVFAGGQVSGPDGGLRGRVKLRLSRDQVARAKRLLVEGYTQREVADLLGIPHRRLRERVRDQLGIRVGQGRVRRGIRKTPFPELTDEEIAARTAEIRATWSEETRLERWQRHEPPNVG